jgi:hypothetical protein
MVPIPWQQFSNPALRHICDASEHVGQPCLWIDVIELGRLCRAPNYAERLWNDALSRRICGPLSGHPPVPFGIV